MTKALVLLVSQNSLPNLQEYQCHHLDQVAPINPNFKNPNKCLSHKTNQIKIKLQIYSINLISKGQFTI